MPKGRILAVDDQRFILARGIGLLAHDFSVFSLCRLILQHKHVRCPDTVSAPIPVRRPDP